MGFGSRGIVVVGSDVSWLQIAACKIQIVNQ
jgi:hypothetical protein